uniref:Ovule protein n=1 Tax=Panagrolaimus sp. JU765 TaxID=591449 RepID=A0AC34R8Z1_9BILA
MVRQLRLRRFQNRQTCAKNKQKNNHIQVPYHNSSINQYPVNNDKSDPASAQKHKPQKTMQKWVQNTGNSCPNKKTTNYFKFSILV